MNANELRIGNWVEFDGRQFQIDSVAREFPTLNTEEFGIGVVDWNNISPIVISEEVLLKCGFVKAWGDYSIDDYSYSFSGQFSYIDAETIYVIAQNIKYLHQLQNLCFALTGQELTYTP